MSVKIAVLDRPPPLLFKKFKLFAIAIFINLLTTLLLVKERFYLDAYNKSGDMTYEVVRTVKVAPGIYTLQAVARTDALYALSGPMNR